MKIVITGGLGFIFSHVTEYFLKKGYEVHLFDNEGAGSNPGLLKQWQNDNAFNDCRLFYYKVSVDNPRVESMIERINPEYIIHAAAISDVDYSIRNPQLTIESNTMANLVVFEAARRCKNLKKFLYVSTDEVYGECETRKHEDEILFPKNPYAMSKAHGSLLRLAYDNTYPELKDKTCETRFCNVFGPRQDTRKIFPLIKQSLETGKSIPLHNEGEGFREYIYVKNIPSVLDLILEKGDRTYNVTLNDGYTVHQLLEKATELTGKPVATHPTNRPGMDMKYQMDNARIKALGWEPLYTFEQGIAEYLHETI